MILFIHLFLKRSHSAFELRGLIASVGIKAQHICPLGDFLDGLYNPVCAASPRLDLVSFFIIWV